MLPLEDTIKWAVQNPVPAGVYTLMLTYWVYTIPSVFRDLRKLNSLDLSEYKNKEII